MKELELPVRASALAKSWDASAPSMQLASVVAEFAEILRRSYWAKNGSFAAVLDRVRELDPELRREQKVRALLGLVRAADRLQTGGDERSEKERHAPQERRR